MHVYAADKVANEMSRTKISIWCTVKELVTQSVIGQEEGYHMTTPRGEANLVDCHPDADFEPSDEFLAGFKFAAELVGDENFDY